MQLIDELRRQQTNEPSYFQQHLLAEDMKRLERLVELADANGDVDAFISEGMMIGWTPNDLRTHELGDTLKPLLAAIHARSELQEGSPNLAAADALIFQLWQVFDTNRMERLIGCLARVPAPTDVSEE